MSFKTQKIGDEDKVLEKVKQQYKKVCEHIRPSAAPRRMLASFGIILVLFITFKAYALVSQLNFDFSFSNIVNTFFGEDLQTDSFGRTNIILMGVGGGNHDGPDLTDSIVVASYHHSKNIASLISIPRDLYVQMSPGSYERINAVYGYYYRNFGKDEAVSQMKQLIKNITGLQIQYYAKINFQGFKEVVDIVGGIDVYVAERLVDEAYPIENEKGIFVRNELFVVEKGWQQMDGNTALKYARSRHADSDFGRSERQHVVLAAIKEKAMKENYFNDTNALKRLYYAVSSNLETDVSLPEMIRAGILAKNVTTDHMISVGLNDNPAALGGLLYTPNREWTNGAAVLLPNGATMKNFNFYTDIRRFVDMVTSNQEIFTEQAQIKISNGTKVSGLATELKNKLSRYGFHVGETGNTKEREIVDMTKIYVYSDNVKVTLDNLQTFISGEIVYLPSSFTENENVNVNSSPASKVDIEIVIGKNDYER